jgi:hypothetical protein
MFRILCRVSGGVTGTRTGYLKRNGKVVEFDIRETAQSEADRLNAVKHEHTTASFSYTVEEEKHGVRLGVVPAAKPKVTLDQIMAAIGSGGYIGFCLACGFEQEGVEPDARKYVCESCGEKKVYGAEELLIMNVA